MRKGKKEGEGWKGKREKGREAGKEGEKKRKKGGRQPGDVILQKGQRNKKTEYEMCGHHHPESCSHLGAFS